MISPVVAVILASPVQAQIYDMKQICRAERDFGREVAIATVMVYYGVSELTAQRIVYDC